MKRVIITLQLIVKQHIKDMYLFVMAANSLTCSLMVCVSGHGDLCRGAEDHHEQDCVQT